MAKINPMDEKFDGQEKTPQCGIGRKLLAAVGFERYESSTGKPMLGVRFVCLLDRAGNGDEGHVTFDNFALTDNALWRLVSLARGIGWTEPFDPDDDDDVGKLLLHGYVEAELVNETFNGRTSVRPAKYEKPGDYDNDPGWGAVIEEAEDQFRQYLEWRANNPRGAGDGGNSGGGKRSSGGGSQRADIPF